MQQRRWLKMALTAHLENIIMQRGYLRSAHRGAPSFADGNTDAAVLAALQHHPDLIEIDVHSSSDGQIVLWHDDDVKTSGQRLKIAETKLEVLRELRFKDNAKIITLEEALEITDGQAGLLIDLKAKHLEHKITEILQQHHAENAVVCGGYISSLKAFQAFGIKVSYTPDPVQDIFWQRRQELWTWDAMTVHHRTVSKALLTRAEAVGMRVIAWTVDDAKRMQELITLGIHGITTNKIEMLSALEVV